MAEIDGRLFEPTVDDDDAAPEPTGGPFFGAAGDVWLFERGHRLLQGDARDAVSFDALMGGEKARALVCDPPYGCKIDGHASKSHPDFIDGSKHDLRRVERSSYGISAQRPAPPPGRRPLLRLYDGRGLHTLMNAAALAGLTQIALCVWDKVHPAMGSFYRQQAEPRARHPPQELTHSRPLQSRKLAKKLNRRLVLRVDHLGSASSPRTRAIE